MSGPVLGRCRSTRPPTPTRRPSPRSERELAAAGERTRSERLVAGVDRPDPSFVGGSAGPAPRHVSVRGRRRPDRAADGLADRRPPRRQPRFDGAHRRARSVGLSGVPRWSVLAVAAVIVAVLGSASGGLFATPSGRRSRRGRPRRSAPACVRDGTVRPLVDGTPVRAGRRDPGRSGWPRHARPGRQPGSARCRRRPASRRSVTRPAAAVAARWPDVPPRVAAGRRVVCGHDRAGQLDCHRDGVRPRTGADRRRPGAGHPARAAAHGRRVRPRPADDRRRGPGGYAGRRREQCIRPVRRTDRPDHPRRPVVGRQRAPGPGFGPPARRARPDRPRPDAESD